MEVLDKGYVKLLNIEGPSSTFDNIGYGSTQDTVGWVSYDEDLERAPAQCARVSFDYKGEKTFEEDMKLNKYLWDHGHTSPFEMIETWWEVKCPIFIARQWVRHRTASINEVSGRYVEMGTNFDFYVPESENVGKPAGKQGRIVDGSDTMATHHTGVVKYELACQTSLQHYRDLLSMGWPKELARGVLPGSTYTKFLWKQDLKNLMHLLKLRGASNAQWEFQKYAEAMKAQLRERIPNLMEIMDE